MYESNPSASMRTIIAICPFIAILLIAPMSSTLDTMVVAFNSTSGDDDGDGILNSVDDCSNGTTNWTSNTSSDYDGDGCKDIHFELENYEFHEQGTVIHNSGDGARYVYSHSNKSSCSETTNQSRYNIQIFRNSTCVSHTNLTNSSSVLWPGFYVTQIYTENTELLIRGYCANF